MTTDELRELRTLLKMFEKEHLNQHFGVDSAMFRQSFVHVLGIVAELILSRLPLLPFEENKP